MKLNTMAAVMDFISRMETDSSAFYVTCAERYPQLRDTLLSLAKENRKFEKVVKQTYFGVITDAIEAPFSFEHLNTDDYNLEITLPENASLPQVIRKTLEMEKTIETFYRKAAEVSIGLMADIPRLFKRIAEKRKERELAIESLGRRL
jgi:rubrerythrin